MRRIVTVDRARWVVLAAAAVALLAACSDDGDDSSTTKNEPTTVNVQAGVNDQSDRNIVVTEFLPGAVSIVAGSTVEWRFAGLERHSVTLLAPGRAAPAPGSAEAQALSGPSTPPATAYDGVSLVNSGLLPADATAPKSFSLTFPSEGEFSYVCIIYPGMTGTVTVLGPEAPVDTQADVDKRADSELGMWLDEGRAAKKKLTDAGPRQVRDEGTGATTWTYEAGATTAHTDVQVFVPGEGEIRPGDRVTFVNNSASRHTATFAAGEQAPRDPNEPAVANPSSPSPIVLKPGGPPVNSGILPPVAPQSPPPEPVRSFTFVLPEAGTYPFVCLFHSRSGMGGTVKVA